MGILNVTPDSFADGGAYVDPGRALDVAQQFEADGADLIDIGGESTRPGAELLPVGEELDRVLPVLERVAAGVSVPISVDTYKADVARRALDAGAVMINDVSALSYDSGLAGVVAAAGVPVVLMHNRGRSSEMYREARYENVVTEVRDELSTGIQRATDAGISRDQIIVDPGLGFAKQAPHTLSALANLRGLTELDRPILVGPSRKSFLTSALGDVPPDEREWGTAAAVTAAVLLGAHIVRVHGVCQMSQGRPGDRRDPGVVGPRRERMADYFLTAWPDVGLGWLDVVDIAIVGFLIYEFLKLIRRTRAAQMVLGVLLVVGLYYASERGPLPTVNWLVRDMFGYIVFTAIVLFQADIRRALSTLGQAPFFRYLARPTTTDETIEEVVVAATMLASRRIGALVVIERSIGLRNYIESGIPLDSTVTYDLLLSVFQTDSPLHDGAVIIQENRIAAAACFLPLTVNPRLGKELGSRHRAAIGLTEEADAVALVASEETGTLSLALDGQIERDLDPDQLRFRLEALMLGVQPTPSRSANRGGLEP